MSNDSCGKYNTTDGLHLTPKDARKFTIEFVKKVNKILGEYERDV